MNVFVKFLYKYNVLEIHKKDVEKWLKNEDLDSLKYGIKEGVYDIRLLCLKAYISFNTNDLKNVLLIMVNDFVPIVSKFACSTLEQQFNDQQVQKIITRKRSYWKKYEYEMKQVNYAYHNSSIGQKKSPSNRLNDRLEEQRKMNDVPIGY